MNNNHFVYIYKDQKSSIQYIGYGKNPERAVSHQNKTHNKTLEELIKNGEYTVHIAGPFEDEMTARAVEAALISALNPFCNQKQEKKEWRFRPIGIDGSLAYRLSESPLKKDDFLKKHNQVLFVRISNENFSDRVGYDISSPPSDEEILSRVRKYWQLNKYLPDWVENPKESPSLLVGITGAPGSQIVIAATEIDTKLWGETEVHHKGRIEIPLKNNQIDISSFRGRRVDVSVGLKFGAILPKFFNILKNE
ncbi:hypothetical protein [uncultured Tolumonas sp.]|uniref:hypothetical protein n=1 Tax=uncultured Tolumonas sp. TaxID=263765 RepID=UPI002A0A3399|nr:hypothetical protein [uncultured Tolumonas sp.]